MFLPETNSRVSALMPSPLRWPTGVPRGPFVPADHMALLVYKIAGLHRLAGIALQKGGVIAVRHKADVLAVMLAGIAKPLFLGNGAHGVLVHAARGNSVWASWSCVKE